MCVEANLGTTQIRVRVKSTPEVSTGVEKACEGGGGTLNRAR